MTAAIGKIRLGTLVASEMISIPLFPILTRCGLTPLSYWDYMNALVSRYAVSRTWDVGAHERGRSIDMPGGIRSEQLLRTSDLSQRSCAEALKYFFMTWWARRSMPSTRSISLMPDPWAAASAARPGTTTKLSAHRPVSMCSVSTITTDPRRSVEISGTAWRSLRARPKPSTNPSLPERSGSLLASVRAIARASSSGPAICRRRCPPSSPRETVRSSYGTGSSILLGPATEHRADRPFAPQRHRLSAPPLTESHHLPPLRGRRKDVGGGAPRLRRSGPATSSGRWWRGSLRCTRDASGPASPLLQESEDVRAPTSMPLACGMEGLPVTPIEHLKIARFVSCPSHTVHSSCISYQ